MQTAGKIDSATLLNRLTKFGTHCRKLVESLPKNEANRIYGSQLLRASSSPGANYIEALEALSRKDFIHRLRICRKEARESNYWLTHISDANTASPQSILLIEQLLAESNEIVRIFTASIKTAEQTSL